MKFATATLHEGFGVIAANEIDHGLTVGVRNTDAVDGPIGIVIEGTNSQKIVLTEANFAEHLAVQLLLALPALRRNEGS